MTKTTERLLGRLGLTTIASRDAEVRALTDRLDAVRRTNARTAASRDRAWTFVLACKREGLLPDARSAWGRYANSMTASESEGDIADDIRDADALRATLGPVDAGVSR